MNVDIKPFQTWVKTEFLYDMEAEKKGLYTKCTVFALTSYHNEALTCQILLDDGTLFSYIPLHALAKEKEQNQPLELRDLVYHNCNTTEIEYHSFEHLKGIVQCYFKFKEIWIPGKYAGTIDFYTGNDMLHFVKLENGQYCVLPTHKIKFRNGKREFEKFKKMHQIWKV